MPTAAPAQYDTWLDFFFGRFERDCDDPWQMDWEYAATPAETADLFIYTMEHCGRDLAAYTDAQVAAGLNGLLFGSLGNTPHTLIGADVSDEQKIAILRSFKHLYADCLQSRCPPVLGHLSETQGSPLEFVTYMLWDVSPIDQMAMSSSDRMRALFEALDVALHLSNEACIESALHGLGHLGGRARADARAMIDAWLRKPPQVRPALIDYARAARKGMIQ